MHSGYEIFSEYLVPHSRDNRPEPFQPYADNGGSVVAIAGMDFAIIGADTRLSSGFSIYTRHQKKLFKLSYRAVLGATGCWSDTLALTKVLQTHMKIYEYENKKVMSLPAVAQMMSTAMYYKRFFPYYVSNILAGLDNEGKGCVYSFDPFGHCDKSDYRAGGSAGAQLQPLLDNQIGFNNMQNVKARPIRRDKALALLKDVFISATERDIYTGDCIDILTITDDGVQEEKFKLRQD